MDSGPVDNHTPPPGDGGGPGWGCMALCFVAWLLAAPAFATDIFYWELNGTKVFSDEPPRREEIRYRYIREAKWGFELPPEETLARAAKAREDRIKAEEFERIEKLKRVIEIQQNREYHWRAAMSTDWGRGLVDSNLERLEEQKKRLHDEEMKIRHW